VKDVLSHTETRYQGRGKDTLILTKMQNSRLFRNALFVGMMINSRPSNPLSTQIDIFTVKERAMI
jgi:hypothetical protein